MKIIKIISVGLLFVLSLMVLSTLLSGVTVTIEGKGRGETTINEEGTWSYECIGSVGECRLEINFPVN